MSRALSIVYVASIVGYAAADAAGGCHPTFHSGKTYTIGEWASTSVTTATPISYVACSSPGVDDCHTSGFKRVGGFSSSNIYNFQCISDDGMCSNDGYAPGSINSQQAWARESKPCSVKQTENADVLLRTDESSADAGSTSDTKSISRRLQGPTPGPSTSPTDAPTAVPTPTVTNLPTPTITSQKPTSITNGPSTSKPTAPPTSQKPISTTTGPSTSKPTVPSTSQKPISTTTEPSTSKPTASPTTSIPTPNPADPASPTSSMPTPQSASTQPTSVGPTTASPTTSKPTSNPTQFPTCYDARRPTRKPQYWPDHRHRNHCLCPCSGSKSSKHAKNSKEAKLSTTKAGKTKTGKNRNRNWNQNLCTCPCEPVVVPPPSCYRCRTHITQFS